MESNPLWLEIVVVLGTALLSSAFTLGFAYWVFQRRVRPRLEAEVEARLLRMQEEMGQLIRARVRQGVLDAVTALPSTNVLRETQKTVARTAADLVEGGLSALWGEKPRRGDE